MMGDHMTDELIAYETPSSAFEASINWVRVWLPGVDVEVIGVSKAKIGRYFVFSTHLRGWVVCQDREDRNALLEDYLSPNEAVAFAISLAAPEAMEANLMKPSE